MREIAPLADLRTVLLWDLDGTIADIRRDIASGVAAVLAERGLPALSVDRVTRHVGQGVRHLVPACLAEAGSPISTPQETERALAVFREHYRLHLMDTTVVYGSLAETLRELRRRGRRMAVVSNKPADMSHEILDRLGILSCFAAVLGGDSLPQKKPGPEPFLHALRLCDRSASPGGAIVIGDSIFDLQGARAAGMAMCAAGWGFDPDGSLRQADPDWRCETPEDLSRSLLP